MLTCLLPCLLRLLSYELFPQLVTPPHSSCLSPYQQILPCHPPPCNNLSNNSSSPKTRFPPGCVPCTRNSCPSRPRSSQTQPTCACAPHCPWASSFGPWLNRRQESENQ